LSASRSKHVKTCIFGRFLSALNAILASGHFPVKANNLRTIHVFMLRVLVDPDQPCQLVGTILQVPLGETIAFHNEQELLRSIFHLMKPVDPDPRLENKHPNE
jgi:hypothetical protein